MQGWLWFSTPSTQEDTLALFLLVLTSCTLESPAPWGQSFSKAGNRFSAAACRDTYVDVDADKLRFPRFEVTIFFCLRWGCGQQSVVCYASDIKYKSLGHKNRWTRRDGLTGCTLLIDWINPSKKSSQRDMFGELKPVEWFDWWYQGAELSAQLFVYLVTQSRFKVSNIRLMQCNAINSIQKRNKVSTSGLMFCVCVRATNFGGRLEKTKSRWAIIKNGIQDPTGIARMMYIPFVATKTKFGAKRANVLVGWVARSFMMTITFQSFVPACSESCFQSSMTASAVSFCNLTLSAPTALRNFSKLMLLSVHEVGHMR